MIAIRKEARSQSLEENSKNGTPGFTGEFLSL